MAKSFHCDNCGESVSPDEERCPGCGRFFRAVRCPICAYTGKGAEFIKGCPVCGYLEDKVVPPHRRKKKRKEDLLRFSKFFAYSAIVFLSLLLIYFLYLYSKI